MRVEAEYGKGESKEAQVREKKEKNGKEDNVPEGRRKKRRCRCRVGRKYSDGKEIERMRKKV